MGLLTKPAHTEHALNHTLSGHVGMDLRCLGKAHEGIDGQLGAPAGVHQGVAYADELLQGIGIGADPEVRLPHFTHAVKWREGGREGGREEGREEGGRERGREEGREERGEGGRKGGKGRGREGEGREKSGGNIMRW